MKKVLLFFFLPTLLYAQMVTFQALDFPNDDGSSILLKWKMQPLSGDSLVIFRNNPDNSKEKIASVYHWDEHFSAGKWIDSKEIEPKEMYRYDFILYDSSGHELIKQTEEAVPIAQWFHTGKISLLILAIILAIFISYYIFSAKSGKEYYIRKISGLESMDEAVGRATEMGKPILFIPGTLDLDDMQTIAGLTILGKIAQKAAEHDSKMLVPVCRSMVLSTAKEVVKEAYLKAGRVDAFDPDCVFYLTDDQFGFVAGVDGIIVREKPAANFYLGAFYAESLILAETGFASGAIQTSGTAMPSQLPFFVAACDYTLIGEELFAASAYLSKDPQQLGSLRGQDVGKAIFIAILVIGVILEIAGISFLKDFLTIH
jgi:hypothetical protein